MSDIEVRAIQITEFIRQKYPHLLKIKDPKNCSLFNIMILSFFSYIAITNTGVTNTLAQKVTQY